MVLYEWLAKKNWVTPCCKIVHTPESRSWFHCPAVSKIGPVYIALTQPRRELILVLLGRFALRNPLWIRDLWPTPWIPGSGIGDFEVPW